MSRGFAPLLAAALALALRALYLGQSADNPSFFAPVVDSQSYDALARELASGSKVPGNLFYQGSFYPLFLAAVYALSNGSILAAKLAQIAVGSATCALTAMLGRRLFGERVGLAAGLVTALHAPLFFFEAELLATGWSAFWSVLLLLGLLWADEGTSRVRAGLFALAGALACITRPTFLPFFMFASGWLMLRVTPRLRTRADRVIWLAALATGFAAIAVPFAVLNESVTGRYSILPHSGGLNLYIGNHPDREAAIATRPADFYEIGDLPTHHGVTDAAGRERFYTSRVVEYAVTDPLGFAGGMIRKTLEFASPRELPRNVDVYLFREWSPLLESLVWKLGPWGFPNGLLFPLALLGLALHWRSLPMPVRWFPILYSAAIIAVFVSARYRVALAPISALFACGAVAALARDWADGRKLRAGCGVALVALFSLLTALPGPFAQERTDYRTELHYAVGTQHSDRAEQLRAQGDDEAATRHEGLAREHLELALTRDPSYAHAHANLGVLAFRAEDYETADTHFRAALRIDPEHPGALAGRTRSLRALGRSIEAQTHMRKATAILEAARQRALER